MIGGPIRRMRQTETWTLFKHLANLVPNMIGLVFSRNIGDISTASRISDNDKHQRGLRSSNLPTIIIEPSVPESERSLPELRLVMEAHIWQLRGDQQEAAVRHLQKTDRAQGRNLRHQERHGVK